MSTQNSKKLGEMIADVNDIVEQTYYYEQKVFEWNQKIESNKFRINKALGRRKKLSVKVDDDLKFNVTKNIQVDIEFFPDQLKAALDKETFNKIVDKQVYINNLNGMIKMMKHYGVPPQEFKRFISVNRVVNNDKIDNLIEMGEIEISDIQGCYKADFTEDIKIRKVK